MTLTFNIRSSPIFLSSSHIWQYPDTVYIWDTVYPDTEYGIQYIFIHYMREEEVRPGFCLPALTSTHVTCNIVTCNMGHVSAGTIYGQEHF